MCVPIGSSRMSFIAAEIVRARRAPTNTQITAPVAVAPIVAATFSTTARAVTFDTPLGRMTFYKRERRAARQPLLMEARIDYVRQPMALAA